MDVEIRRASLDEKPILRHLMQLCLHDYSEYNGDDVDGQGLFGYKYLDPYWTESERHPFLVRVASELAGFVLVRAVDAQEESATHAITEFFVLRKYRRQGIGKSVAWQIFDMFPGPWSIYQEKDNGPAQSFWRQVIAEYTQGAYAEEHLQTEEWQGPRHRFH